MQYTQFNKKVAIWAMLACPPLEVMALALFIDQLAGVMLTFAFTAIFFFCITYLVQYRRFVLSERKKALGGGQSA